MTKYMVRRVVMAFVTLTVVACTTFFLMNAIPGNPWLSEKTPTQATIDALNAKYGLDQPLLVQLGKYLGNLVQGDFGTSIKMQKNRPVLQIILEMFPVSAKVGVLAILWAVVAGVPLGCLAAFKRGTWVDSFLRIVCTIGISMPGFVVATLLLHTLCGGIAGLKLFPALFDGTPASYVLPCLALGFYPMCYLSRQTRTAMRDHFQTCAAQRPDSGHYVFGSADCVYPVRRACCRNGIFYSRAGQIFYPVHSEPGLSADHGDDNFSCGVHYHNEPAGGCVL